VLAPEALYGLAGEIVHRLEPHSEADPAALLVSTLATFGPWSVLARTPSPTERSIRRGSGR
jgi:hypothetical protein